MFGPLLPFLEDSQASIEAMLARAADVGVDAVWFDALNPRPRVWESVQATLRKSYPDLIERYRRVLFVDRIRHAYIESLRERIRNASAKVGLRDRIDTLP